MQKKSVKIIICFCLFMVIITIISRISASVSVPKVDIKTTQRMKISHQVILSGKVEPAFEEPIFLREGLYIDKVYVLEGERIKKNQAMLSVNKDKTEEQLQELTDEKNKLELQLEMLRSEAKNNDIMHNQNIKYAEEQLAFVDKNTEKAVNAAYKELKAAETYYKEIKNKYEKENEEENEEENTVTIEMIESAEQLVQEKKQIYEQALVNRDEQLLVAQNGLENATIDLVKNTTIEQSEIQLKQVEEKITILKKIVDDDYKLKSNKKGIVSKILVNVGETIPTTASFVLADDANDYKITIPVDEQDVRYISTGMEVKLCGIKNNEEVEYIGKIDAIKTNSNIDGLENEVTIYVPAEEFVLYSYVSVEVENFSDYYDYCLPLTALNQDDKGYFVYVIENEETVLGKELIARKIYVKIADKNQEFVAILPGTITDIMDIIIDSNKEVIEGSRVRIDEL